MRAHFDVRRAGECLRLLHFGSESKRIAKSRNHTHLSFLNASLSALSQDGENAAPAAVEHLMLAMPARAAWTPTRV